MKHFLKNGKFLTLFSVCITSGMDPFLAAPKTVSLLLLLFRSWRSLLTSAEIEESKLVSEICQPRTYEKEVVDIPLAFCPMMKCKPTSD